MDVNFKLEWLIRSIFRLACQTLEFLKGINARQDSRFNFFFVLLDKRVIFQNLFVLIDLVHFAMRPLKIPDPDIVGHEVNNEQLIKLGHFLIEVVVPLRLMGVTSPSTTASFLNFGLVPR